MNNKILILGDDRPGTLSQSVGLAQELGLEFQIINLTYNRLSFLPNFIFSKSLFRLNKSTKLELEKITDFPKFIISAGRKSATIALYLKNKSQGKSKILQIMNPNLNFKKFDLVILPKHDDVAESDNLITTIGALNKVNEQKISDEKEKYSSLFVTDKKVKIVLMLGGSSKNRIFSNEAATRLAKSVSNIAKNMNAALFILNSRRTGDELTATFKSNLDCDAKFFDWKNSDNQNPYFASLAIADFFIITGDSVSMISECCTRGKAVYIFDEKEFSSKKHRKFHQNLIDNNYAKKLDLTASELEIFESKKLQETQRISQIIRNKF